MNNNNKIMGGRRVRGNLPQHLELKKDWYYYVITIRGKAKWYPLQTKDVSVALKKWATLEAELRKRKNVSIPVLNGNGMLFKDLWKEYKEKIHKHKSEKTKQEELRIIELLFKEFGNERISEITKPKIIRYHDSLKATPFEANRRLSLIRHMLRKAAEWGDIETNPAVEIEKFEEKKHKLKLTTEILFEKMYPNADIKLKTAIMLGFHLAQHENEVKGIKWSEIDFDKREIKLIRKKTDKEIVIHINETLYQFLCYLKSKRSSIADYLIYHYDYENKKFVPYKSFKSLWKKALIKAGLAPGDYKFKELRHLANTSMKDAGITVDKRMAVTGHTNIASNEVYTHKTVGDSIDAARSLEKFRPAKF